MRYQEGKRGKTHARREAAGAGLPRQNQPNSMEKACQNEAATSTVEVAACFFAAQDRPGGPRARPAPPLLPRGGAPGEPWKPLEN